MKDLSCPVKRPCIYHIFLFSLLLFFAFSTYDLFFAPNNICFVPQKLEISWGVPFITLKYWIYTSNNTSGYSVILLALLANLFIYFILTLTIYYLFRFIKSKFFCHFMWQVDWFLILDFQVERSFYEERKCFLGFFFAIILLLATPLTASADSNDAPKKNILGKILFL